jgi:23S rRNA pseudouridine1911/1915/1917 synthase
MPTFHVSRAESGQTLAESLREHLAVTWAAAKKLVRDRRVRVAGNYCLDPSRRVAAGQRIEVRQGTDSGKKPATTPRAKPMDIRVRHVDEQVVVVEKPSGLTTMRHPEEAAEFGRRAQHFLPPTLVDLLPPLLPPAPNGRAARLFAVHRIDKETTGLVVFARTGEAERHLCQQFRTHSVDRRYLALVRGKAKEGRIESWIVRDRGDGRRGSGKQGEGQHAVTNVRIVEELGDYTLVECRLETGRTHQVRIHLGEAGTPLCGERIYDRPLNGRPLPDGSGAKHFLLHAARLGFDHPATGKRVIWDADIPVVMRTLLQKLRGR